MDIQSWQEYSCNATKNMHKCHLHRSNSPKCIKAVNVTEKTDLHRNSFDFKTGKYTSTAFERSYPVK